MLETIWIVSPGLIDDEIIREYETLGSIELTQYGIIRQKWTVSFNFQT